MRANSILPLVLALLLIDTVVVSVALALSGIKLSPRLGGPASPSVIETPPVVETPSVEPTATVRPTFTADRTAIATFAHVYLIVLEDKDLTDIVMSADAPYLNSLIARSVLATSYHAVSDQSRANYFALVSGATQDVGDDDEVYLDAPTLMDQLERAGRSWAVFAQNVPLGCFRGVSASDGPDGPGRYVRRHEPAVSFTGIVADAARCARITDLAHFEPGRADFSLIVPNLCYAMHDCGVREGDGFVERLVPSITGSPSWGPRDLIFITFDEGDATTNIPLIVHGALVRAGEESDAPGNHYALLRTLQESWNLDCLAESCFVGPLADLFGTPGS